MFESLVNVFILLKHWFTGFHYCIQIWPMLYLLVVTCKYYDRLKADVMVLYCSIFMVASFILPYFTHLYRLTACAKDRSTKWRSYLQISTFFTQPQFAQVFFSLNIGFYTVNFTLYFIHLYLLCTLRSSGPWHVNKLFMSLSKSWIHQLSLYVDSPDDYTEWCLNCNER